MYTGERVDFNDWNGALVGGYNVQYTPEELERMYLEGTGLSVMREAAGRGEVGGAQSAWPIRGPQLPVVEERAKGGPLRTEKGLLSTSRQGSPTRPAGRIQLFEPIAAADN